MTLSMKRIGGVTVAAAVVFVAIWYIALFRPQQHKLAAANRESAAASQQASQLRQQVASLKALERQIPADSARLKAVDAALPQTEDLQDVFTQLNQAAVTSGVQLTGVTPSAAQSTTSGSSSGSTGAGSSGSAASGPGTKQVGMTMVLSGSYPSVMTFLTDLAHMTRIVVVDGVSFSPSTNSIGTTLTTRIFYAG